jgi:hypothetical protein
LRAIAVAPQRKAPIPPAHLDPVKRNPDHWWSKLPIHNVSNTWFTLAALFSYFTMALSVLKGAEHWQVIAESLWPWVLLFIISPLIQTRPEDRLHNRIHPDHWYARIALHRVPTTFILVASAISLGIVAGGLAQGLPNWLTFGLSFVPWFGIVAIELEWVYEHFGWFALFTLMAAVQTIHYSEHCIEVIQYHIFHQSLAQSIAIFSTLNVELVHFTGDTFLTIGTILLLMKYPRNPFLWVAIPFQIAHQAEHTYLTYNYLFNGAKPGGPGLLGSPGGAIGGGIGLNRPDLHWFYNTFYTIPFVAALIWETKHVYDRSLARAFPELSKSQLIETGKHLETLHFAAGETVLAPGDPIDRLYIISDGEATVYRTDENGREVEVASLRKGQYVGEIGLLVPNAPHTKTVRATTNLTMLAMDEETFRHVLAMSQTTAEHIEQVAHEHMTAPAR